MGNMKYALVQRKNRETGEVRIYANAVNDSLSFEDIAIQAAAETTVTRTDVEGVVRAILDIMKRELLRGYEIRLGNLGSLFPTFTGKGAKNADEFTTNLIKRVNIRFRPTGEVKKELKKATFTLTVTKKRMKEQIKAMKEDLQAIIDASAGEEQEGGE